MFTPHDLCVKNAAKVYLPKVFAEYRKADSILVGVSNDNCMEGFTTWLYSAVVNVADKTEGADVRRFCFFLLLYLLFRRAISINNGTLMFTVMQWVLPFQSDLMHSTFYYNSNLRWVLLVLGFPDEVRRALLTNMAVNVTSPVRATGYIPVDFLNEQYNRFFKVS